MDFAVISNNLGLKKTISESIADTIKRHFKKNWPDATHNFIEDQVQISNGKVYVSAYGCVRAYRDVLIKPINRKYLTIPISNTAKGHKAKDFTLFTITTKDNRKFLARKSNDGVEFMYALKKQVLQKQNSRYMPSDKEISDNIIDRICKNLSGK